MEFAFSDEQEMIRESAEGFLADVSDSAAVRAAMVSERGFDEALWQRLCQEMYWPAIHIPETYGGLGLGFVELAILLEQMGRRLLCSPFFATTCMATPALLLAANDEQKQRWLPSIADGSVTATLGFSSANGWSKRSPSAPAVGRCSLGPAPHGGADEPSAHQASMAARFFPVRGAGGRSDAMMLLIQNRESAGSIVSSTAKALARRMALPLRYSAATCSSKKRRRSSGSAMASISSR